MAFTLSYSAEVFTGTVISYGPLKTEGAIDWLAPTGEDLVIKLGDNAAVNKVSFCDSDGIEVAKVDSNGVITGVFAATGSTIVSATGGVLTVRRDDTAVITNDYIGSIDFQTNDSSLVGAGLWQTVAQITVNASEDYDDANDAGSKISFWTNPVGEEACQIEMKLDGESLYIDHLRELTASHDIQFDSPLTVLDNSVFLRDSDVAHGMTDEVATNVYSRIRNINAASGGVLIEGYTDADTEGVNLIGISGAANPTASAVVIEGRKKDGVTVQALGAAEKLLAFENNGTEVAYMHGKGSLFMTPTAFTSGIPCALTITAPAHTGITAATECHNIDLNLAANKTWAAGAGPLAVQSEVKIEAPTYIGNAAGALTITQAATLTISGAPVQGANMTLTDSRALYIPAGGMKVAGGGSLTGTWSDLGIVTTVDINGGSIDGTAIGAASASTGAFTSLTSTTTDRSTATKEPNGFENRTDTNITQVADLFTLVKVNNYNIWIAGQKYAFTASKSINISDTEGMHYIYMDTDSTLKEAVNPTVAQLAPVLLTKAIVAAVYWDATNNEVVYFGEERHGVDMSSYTHYYLHYTRGLQLVSGGALENFTIGDGSADSHAQFGVAEGTVADEDLGLTNLQVAAATGLPILWRSGATGEWRKEVVAGFSFVNSGVGDNRPVYNQWTGLTWQQTEVTEGNYFLVHVFTSTEHDTPYLAITGQAIYTTLPSARAGVQSEMEDLLLGTLPGPEIKPIGSVIIQCDKDYTNSVNARVVEVDAAGNDYVDWRSAQLLAGTAPSNHSSLSGLTNDDHTQYPLVDGTRGFTLGATAQVLIDADTTANTNTNGGLAVNYRTSTDATEALAVTARSQAATGNTTIRGLNLSTWTDTATTADSLTLHGVYSSVTKAAADSTAGTVTLYGTYSSASNTGSTNVGTKATYGGYFSATGDAAGASTAYGIYATAASADTNWAGYFSGNLFATNIENSIIGAVTPVAGTFTTATAATVKATSRVDLTRTAMTESISSLAGTVYIGWDGAAADTLTIDTDDIAVSGRLFIIKDEGGTAAANPLTIATEGAELIDGNATVQLTTNYGYLWLISNGANLFILNSE